MEHHPQVEQATNEYEKRIEELEATVALLTHQLQIAQQRIVSLQIRSGNYSALYSNS